MGEHTLLHKLPVRFRMMIGPEDFTDLEEIRLRAGRPLELYYGGNAIRLLGQVEREDIKEMLNYLTGYSLYAYEEEIRQGFFTVAGGHRVGIVGHASMERGADGEISDMVDIGGLNIRIAHEKKGVALPFVSYLRREESIYNTLFLAAPGVGKTTYLRDTIRILSEGLDGGPAQKVSVVDERSEIAACDRGVPQNDVGRLTDVLDNCPKRRGMQMVLRSMAPQIIAVDELAVEDFETAKQILSCGIRLLGTVHAGSIGELFEKHGMKQMVKSCQIGRYVRICRGEGGRRRTEIYDGRGMRL